MKNQLINYLAFTILTVLWLGFLAALVFDQEILRATWQAFRSWPLILQGFVGLLTLPVVIGLWIWQTGWAIWLRIILVLGLAWVTIYTFLPWRKSSQAAAATGKSPG